MTLNTPFASPATDGVFGLLSEADRLASGWLVSGPLIADGEVTMFEGIFNVGSGRPHIAGLEWASFSVFQSSAVGGV